MKHYTIALTTILFFCFLFYANGQNNGNSNTLRKSKYPKSKLIKTFEWTGEPQKYQGTNSDMHWFTWGIDDAIYIADDDGKNFQGIENYAHILKITGTPPNHKVETVTDFENYDFRAMIPNKLLRRYVNGILAVDSILYVCLYDYDWNIPGKVYNYDDIYKRIKEYNPWHDLDSLTGTNLGFIDSYSKNAGIAGIIKSKDMGKTWENIPGSHTPQFLGPNFAGMSFITWGPGYTNVPKEFGDYVYGISNNGSWETGDHVYMARVHRDSIIVRKAWQFFNGMKLNKPQWTVTEENAKPIFSDSLHVGHPTMTYNKNLKRYILTIYSDTVPHKENASIQERNQWDFGSELQLYESATPFGPWSIFYNEKPWGGKLHSCYLGQIPAKWFSPDGLSGYMMFAGDYVNRAGEYYGLMIQPFKIVLNKN